MSKLLAQGLNTSTTPQGLIAELREGGRRALISFAGQGVDFMSELRELHAAGGVADQLIQRAAARTKAVAQGDAFVTSGLHAHGYDLALWLREPERAPVEAYLQSTAASLPLILTAQLARYAQAWEHGLGEVFARGGVASLTGHSQGLVAALLVAQSEDGRVDHDKFEELIEVMLWEGLHMAQSYHEALRELPADAAKGAPMVAVGGPTLDDLSRAVAQVNRALDESHHLVISLHNNRTRHVISGPPGALTQLERALTARAEREQAQRKAGRFGGKPLTFTWEPLAVGGAYHGPMMATGAIAMRRTLDALGWRLDAASLKHPVLASDGGGLMNLEADLTARFIDCQFLLPVRWHQTLHQAHAHAPFSEVLDFGPGDGVARLSAAALRGLGARVHAQVSEAGRISAWITPSAQLDAPLSYADYKPKLARLSDGTIAIDNRFSRATGRSPVILPGMTPSTVDAPIVAAAANAGFVAELAGGGQVTEPIFRQRMQDLSEALEPGQEVVFNALYLDPYLWDLHLRKRALVQQLRREGAPISGVTISAGVPEIAEAKALLDELASLGMHLNAFKPGSADQVRKVCAIADACPEHTLFVHVEGGKAGGHHSWEDLEQLLIETYHLLRARQNIVLCVGGGIADEARGVALLTGTWARAHALPDMPVDAIFLGTITMAAREATASPSVKQALAQAAGDPQWVYPGDVRGGVTSGKSQLNADIHYLDNSASRAGRLLDTVAADPSLLQTRRDEVIVALKATCKPYFGDLHAMTYGQTLDRMIALMAIGQGTPYEDGLWLDASYRQRVLDMIHRAEARLCAQDEGALPSVVAGLPALDQPAAVMQTLREAYPQLDAVTMHPLDVTHFIHQICARPGKPVCFVPVIDADVRRWFKSDSLWQAQHPAYDADQVLIIPGPEAIHGIQQADEPIAQILARFDRALVMHLIDAGAPAPDTVGTWALGAPEAPAQAGTMTLSDDALSARGLRGPIAAAFGASTVHDGRAMIPNPLRALCPMRAGTLHLTHDAQGVVTHATYTTAEGEQVTLEADLERHQVSVSARPQQTPAPGSAPATLRFELTAHARPQGGYVSLDGAAYDQAVQRFYQEALFGAALPAPPLHEAAQVEVSASPERARGYARVTGLTRLNADEAPLHFGFSLAWEAIFRALSAPQLATGLLRLVHLSNSFEVGPAWPLRTGQALQSSARVTRVLDEARGRTIEIDSALHHDGALVLSMRSAFFVRESFAHTNTQARAHQTIERALVVSDEEAARWLLAQPGVLSIDHWSPRAGDALTLRVSARREVSRAGETRWQVLGGLWRDDQQVAAIDAAGAGDPDLAAKLIEVLGAPEPILAQATPRLLAQARDIAPSTMTPFSVIGADRNPIHSSPLMARMGGLDGCIVHGMWTSARAHAFLVDEVLSGDASRVLKLQVSFLAPCIPGEPIALRARRGQGPSGLGRVEVEVVALREGAEAALAKLDATVRPPRTAYVFPGQGIQQQGMGMDSYAASRAARAVWDRADAFTRRELGFSILHVVRENPTELEVRGQRLIHERGVLHLTQLTQVAMAVLSMAQIATLREAGMLQHDAIVCGHSVGEYNALGSLDGVLALEVVVRTVYERGMAMHRLVPRDERGESGFRMGVIRPHYAGLDEAQARALVAQICAETNLPLEIVNDNIAGRQYSVVGKIAAIDALVAALEARQRPGSKPAWVLVPGVDVPFHSRVLSEGVAPFRKTLEERLPQTLNTARLLGHYIPNLVPRPFSLELAYIQEVYDYTQSAPLAEVLGDWDAWHATPDRLARRLLIELLSWQFASPVRWIETQDLLMRSTARGGMGVERIIEIGVGYQPTLTGMARYTRELIGPEVAHVEILNIEADADLVFARDADPEVESAPAPSAAQAAPAAQAQPASAPAAAPAPAPQAAGGGVAPEDQPLPVSEALRALLAIQARVRPEQIDAQETIDALFEGVSSRRNQVLLDIGAEFNLGTIDGAHERPLAKLEAEIATRCPRYNSTGRYLRASVDESLKHILGRAGLGRREATAYLEQTFGFGPKLADATLLTLALSRREGDATRGGPLATPGLTPVTDRSSAHAALDAAAIQLGRGRGLNVAKLGGAGAAGAGVVDAAAVAALAEQITGPQGALMRAAKDLIGHLGHSLDAPHPAPDPARIAADAKLARLEREHGTDYSDKLAPMFDPLKHVAFESPWAWTQRDVASLAFDGARGALDATWRKRAARLRHRPDARARQSAAWYADWAARQDAPQEVCDALRAIADSDSSAPLAWTPSRPSLSVSDAGEVRYEEVLDEAPDAITRWLDALDLDGQNPAAALSHHAAQVWGALREGLSQGLDFGDTTALVTGASPDSIALDVVAQLLHGGARVIVTTTTYTKARRRFYRRLYQDHASPGAALHIVPMNQASRQDTEALIAWMLSTQTEQVGAQVKVIKRPMVPDLVLPFGAIKELGTLDQLGDSAEVAMRAMLLNVERLIAGLAQGIAQRGMPARPCHVILPLSPNHGAFGGDGAYAESKAGLEVLLQKWASERDAWGHAITLCGARIGWVRGTGLMQANNLVAPGLEQRAGVRTFSTREMACLIAGLCTAQARDAAAKAPLIADLTGRFGQVEDLKGVVSQLRHDLDARVARAQRAHSLSGAAKADARATLRALPSWPPATFGALGEGRIPSDVPAIALEQLVVVVGAGEVGPFGSSRARFAVEVEDQLSSAAVLELAWTCGLIQFEQGPRGGHWVDVETGEPVDEADIAPRYRPMIGERVGIRMCEPETLGFDPSALPVLATVYLERDMSFTVSSESEARAFALGDPDHTQVRYDATQDKWQVTRLAGAAIRVPRITRLDRSVAGQVPRGLDMSRYGIPRDMIEGVDRLSLYNLIATVEAFLSAGLTPEELMSKVHPARVANTQGSGIGGMRSLQRLYWDHLLGEERQKDILQETLINVIAAYVVQSYVGSYGAMSHPVAACATAAVSIEDACDKILCGKADVVVAGGFDDIGREGMVGFADMNATASADDMFARGLEPDELSRANDTRRRGFVEAQGGGTLLLARGDIALKLGLPVRAVVAYAGSFSDGIQKSIPAPGLGAIAAVMGGAVSPLGAALTRHGLSTDDIAVVYKHDTSTQANDPNENRLHQAIQTRLGRAPGNPLWVVSQKALTGHAKGGSAAWQAIGLCQALIEGVIPGNPNLDCVDPAMAQFEQIGFTDTALRPGPDALDAGLLTSLGFGHVSGIVLLLHPRHFLAQVPQDQRDAYLREAKARAARESDSLTAAMTGATALYQRRAERRLEGADGSATQHAREIAMLTDPDARFDVALGQLVSKANSEARG